MLLRTILLLSIALLPVCGKDAAIIPEVRRAVAQKDFALGENRIQTYRSTQGVTPEMIEALSWLGRGALAAGDLERAEKYADQTRKLALEQLTKRTLDAEKHLPIALGAAIEVRALVLDARGERGEAVSYLRQELGAYRNTSIRTRIQKNIHLLSLEGKPAPPLDTSRWIGLKPSPIDKLRGTAVLLFFWAHWCGDCKGQAPVLAELAKIYGPKGLRIVAPTQHYGYVARGQDATPEQEAAYIEEILKQHYSALGEMPVPLSEENFKNYGASTTPTLVLVDGSGVVQLYHPGAMNFAELASKVGPVTAP